MTDNEMKEIWRESVGGRAERDHSWAPRTWRRRRRMLHVKLLGEFLGGSGAIGVAGWFLYRSASLETVLLLAIVVLVVLLSWGANLRLWRALSRVAHEHTADYIARLLAEAALELRAQVWMSRLVWVSGALIFSWVLYVLWVHADTYLAEPWRGALGVGGISVIFAGMLWQLRHKREVLEDEVHRLKGWRETFLGQHDWPA
ncbi:MAG: hypothetical protein VX475_13330 [Myxococcota bacterium]|nr:hypothetical protein [Myxococcota bacterium]